MALVAQSSSFNEDILYSTCGGDSWMNDLDLDTNYMDDMAISFPSDYPIDNIDFLTSTDTSTADLLEALMKSQDTVPSTTTTNRSSLPLSPTTSISSWNCSDSDTSPSHGSSTHKKQTTDSRARRRRMAHSTVEKNYRDGVNAALQRLQRTIPRFSSPEFNTDGDLAALDARAPTKTAVLHAAVEYIRQLERERDTLQGNCRDLRDASFKFLAARR